MNQIYFRHGNKIGELSFIHGLQIPFLQVLVFSLIQSINPVHFVPKKCSEATTFSLSLTSDVSDSISKAKSFQFSGVNCNWKMRIHFIAIDRPHNSCLFPLRIQLNLKKVLSSEIIIQFLKCILLKATI